MFNTDLDLMDIAHATPAMTMWAIRRAGDVIDDEAQEMVDEKMGLHLRAHLKVGSRYESNQISWEDVQHFSLKHLQEIANNNSPAMTFLLNAYTNKDFLKKEKEGHDVTIRQHQPQNLVSLAAHMAITFGHSGHANIFLICRGIWMFATKAAHTNFCVDSCMGLCVAQSTVYEALKEMAKQKQIDLKHGVHSGKHFTVVFDNIQTYIKQRGRCIGRENHMITGLAATAIEMEDYSPEARQEQKQLTPELIMGDFDIPHLRNIATVHFLQVLTDFMPSLSIYHPKKAELAKILAKTPISPTQKSNITPLATNSTDEMHVQGVKQEIGTGRMHFNTNDLIKHFESLCHQSRLPSFEDLEKVAEVLEVSIGSPWTNPNPTQASTADVIIDDANKNEMPLPPLSDDEDLTLANVTLFMHNGIWWREVCMAIAQGDPERLWIFTFAGSGNPNYSNFLLELYCSFKWECKPELREAILKNWVINRLKDEMEEVAALKRRSKVHGAVGMDNELNAVMKKLREEEVNCFRKGRTYEEKRPVDDFSQGFETLKKMKVEDFIKKSLISSTVLKMHTGGSVSTDLPTHSKLKEEIEDMIQLDELADDNRCHPRMVTIDGTLYTTQSAEPQS
ncbi:hypothetical protein M413DRAFT_13521 [Hebeloma cylindrosporum]|uniref:DUF6589 domain-containing protein n=1 Tax=Hebeloma cylindrosporum TaxID=76867 RepID=A0A0C3C0I1_HEBCY|nr:hypothetical protein M413DRAFT_13521 [Hebeloma cylindrosporum h7]